MSAPTVEQTTNVAATTAPEEETIDLREFNDAVTNAISDGVPSDADLRDVRRVYGELEPRRGKYAARNQVDSDIRSAIEGGNLKDAQALFAVKDALLQSSGAKPSTAKPKDPVESHLHTMGAIGLAWALGLSNPPAGTDATDIQNRANALITTDTQAQAQTYRDWLVAGQNGDEPDVPEIAKSGARVSLGRAPKGQGRKRGKAGASPAAAAPAEVGADGGAPAGFVTQ